MVCCGELPSPAADKERAQGRVGRSDTVHWQTLISSYFSNVPENATPQSDSPVLMSAQAWVAKPSAEDYSAPMLTNGTRRRVRPQQVLGEMAGLSNAQLERLLPQVFALCASRGRHVMGEREAELLECVNRPVPSRLQNAFNRLVQERRAGRLTPAGARQLHELTDKLESFDARRLRCLVELAGLRKTTLEMLMRTLGLKTPAYA